jgi:hypothetical protein
VDTNNTIPEKKSGPTSISIGTNYAHKRSLMDLPEHPPSIDDKNDQGEDPNSKSRIPVDEGTIHLISIHSSLYFSLTTLHTKLHYVLGRSMSFRKTP